MTEPNCFGLAVLFLGPAVYFIAIGLLVPPNRIDWNAVALGLIPGIGLTACASDSFALLKRGTALAMRGEIQRRLSGRNLSPEAGVQNFLPIPTPAEALAADMGK